MTNLELFKRINKINVTYKIAKGSFYSGVNKIDNLELSSILLTKYPDLEFTKYELLEVLETLIIPKWEELAEELRKELNETISSQKEVKKYYNQIVSFKIVKKDSDLWSKLTPIQEEIRGNNLTRYVTHVKDNVYLYVGDKNDAIDFVLEGKNTPIVNKFNSYVESAVSYLDEIDGLPVTVEDLNRKEILSGFCRTFIKMVPLRNKETKQIIGYTLVDDGTSRKLTPADFLKATEYFYLNNRKPIVIKNLANDGQTPCYVNIPLPTHYNKVDIGLWNFFKYSMDDDSWHLLKAFVYAIFNADYHTSVGIFLLSNGRTWKSILCKVLAKILGRGAGAFSDTHVGKDHGGPVFLNKRFAYNEECKKPNIIHLDFMHTLITGGTAVINEKMKSMFEAYIHASTIICSNEEPSLNSFELNQTRRWNIIRQKPVSKENLIKLGVLNEKNDFISEHDIIESLCNSLSNFLIEAKESFDKLAKPDGTFRLSQTLKESKLELDSEITTAMIEFLDTHLDYMPVLSNTSKNDGLSISQVYLEMCLQKPEAIKEKDEKYNISILKRILNSKYNTQRKNTKFFDGQKNVLKRDKDLVVLKGLK